MQSDKAAKAIATHPSGGWSRHRMNETHRKGRLGFKKLVARARRRLDAAVAKEEA